MVLDPYQRVALGRTGLAVTRLGFGAASIGGLYTSVTDVDARAVIDHAWTLGIRLFDVAPLYGYGSAEERLGRALTARPRDEFVLSTKVGRLVRRPGELRPGDELDPQALADHEDAFYPDVAGRRIVYDYSRDGILRSVEASLERLGLSRIDILFIHDPDRHWQVAIDEAYPALEELRSAGVVRAIGAGMNQSAMLTRFATETDIDVVLLAGRYTLLDQEALPELLPACLERGIAVVVGDVINSGVLVDPQPGSRFNYLPAPTAVIERGRRIAAVCARYGVPPKAAAIQFPLAHPAVTALVAGVRTIGHLDDYPAAMRLPIPAQLWAELRAEGLIAAGAPIPG